MKVSTLLLAGIYSIAITTSSLVFFQWAAPDFPTDRIIIAGILIAIGSAGIIIFRGLLVDIVEEIAYRIEDDEDEEDDDGIQ